MDQAHAYIEALAVLNVMSKDASARQAARGWYRRASPAPRFDVARKAG